MDEVLKTKLSEHHKLMFNQVRLFMKVCTVSDIYDENKKNFHTNVLKCTEPIGSNMGWPKIKPFPSSWIRIWESVLITSILPRVRMNTHWEIGTIRHMLSVRLA